MYDWEWEEYLLFVAHLRSNLKTDGGILAEDEMHSWNDHQWEQWALNHKSFGSILLMEQMK